MLRSFVDSEHSNWDEMLPLCEFAYNNARQRSPGKTPFQMLLGRDPVTPAAMLGVAGFPRPSSDVAAEAWLVRLHRAWESANAAMQAAAAAQKAQADGRTRPTSIKEGDLVKLETRYVLKARVGGPKAKLNPQWVGPFKVVKMVSPNAARLELPSEWRMHPVVNVSRLEPYHELPGRFPGREQTIVRPEELPLPIPPELPFVRVAGYLASRRGEGQGRPRDLLVQWVDLPRPSWVAAALLAQECRRAYGSDAEHKRLLEKLKNQR